MVFVIVIGIAAVILGTLAFYFFQTQRDVYAKALSLAALGNYLEARALIRERLDLSPGDVKGHYVLSKIYSMESDFENEARHLAQIKKIGKFPSGVEPVAVSNRVADIYYQKERFEEAFFHYLDSIEYQPGEPTASIRLAFMALGQKEFKIAEYFFSKVNSDLIGFSTFFLGKGVALASLERDTDLPSFEKAYSLEKTPETGFLYAMSLFKNRKTDEAIEVADSTIDLVADEYVRYSLYQFMMCCYIQKKEYNSAGKFARLAMETARLQGWLNETIDSDFHLCLFLVKQGKLEEASEYLIEVESEKVDDPEIIELANYKHNLERKIKSEEALKADYDIEKEILFLPLLLFPSSRFYELSGFRMSRPFNIKGLVDETGKKLVRDLGGVGVDLFEKYITLSNVNFKNASTKIAMHFKFRVTKEIANLEGDGVNFLCSSKEDLEKTALFRFRRWKDAKISDVFLRDMVNQMDELGVDAGYLVGNFEITEGGKRYIQTQGSNIIFVTGNDLDKILGTML